MGLTRDAILAADDLKKETVEVPEWGGSVTIREFTAAERDLFESEWLKGKAAGTETDNIRARLVSRTLITDTGERMFSDAEIAILGNKSATALDRLFTVAQRINGMSGAAVDELEKNSGGDRNDDSVSGSPSL